MSLDNNLQGSIDNNIESNEVHNNQGIDINEIKNLEDFDTTEILNSTANDSYFNSLEQEDKVDMAHALAKSAYDFYSRERKNFSDEANALMERIKRGHITTDMENRILLSDEKFLEKNRNILEQIDKLNEIKQRVVFGKIDKSDFGVLMQTIGFDDKMVDIIRQEFVEKGMLVDEYENVNSEGNKTL